MDPCLYLQCFTLDRLYINSFAFVAHISISFSAALFVGEASVGSSDGKRSRLRVK